MSNLKKEIKKNSNRQKIEFYLSFFKNKEGYEELNVNGFWLIKQWDGDKEEWTVHLYSDNSFKNYQRGKLFYKENLLN